MPTILRQRNFFLTQTFELSDNSVNVKIKRLLNYYETDLQYEELGNRVTRFRKPNIRILVGFAVLLLITIAFYFAWRENSQETPIIWVIAFGITTFFMAFGFFISFESKVNLSFNNFNYLSFYASSPSKQEVNDFIEILQNKQRQYLLNRYTRQDSCLSEDQILNNIRWLRDRNIINDLESDEFLNKLLPKSINSPMGFVANPGKD